MAKVSLLNWYALLDTILSIITHLIIIFRFTRVMGLTGARCLFSCTLIGFITIR